MDLIKFDGAEVKGTRIRKDTKNWWLCSEGAVSLSRISGDAGYPYVSEPLVGICDISVMFEELSLGSKTGQLRSGCPRNLQRLWRQRRNLWGAGISAYTVCMHHGMI